MADETLSLLALAEETAVQAGELLRQKWDQPRQRANKGRRDWVTDADYAAQALIVAAIRQRFPKHGFLPEEKDETLPTEGPVIWIIDPVDGTSNYSRQIPAFCISIAAARPIEAGQAAPLQVVAGAIYDPMRDELFSAAAGRPATLNDRPIQVSATPELDEAIVALDWSRGRELRQDALDSLGRLAHEVHTVRAIGSAALALAWVAAGRLDAYFNRSLSAWDVAAGRLLIAQAGGRLTNLQGKPWQIGDAGCLASNGRLQAGFAALVIPPGFSQNHHESTKEPAPPKSHPGESRDPARETQPKPPGSNPLSERT